MLNGSSGARDHQGHSAKLRTYRAKCSRAGIQTAGVQQVVPEGKLGLGQTKEQVLTLLLSV